MHASYPPPWKQGLCFFDMETTGVDVHECALIELAAVTDDGGSLELKLALTPAERLAFHPKAMEVNGYRDEDWVGALQPDAALSLFEAFAWGYCLVGHNIGNFDLRILRRYLGDERYALLVRSTIDTYHLAKAVLGPRGLRKFNLSACCEFVGLPPEGVHRARGGAERCCALFAALTGPGRGSSVPQMQRLASEF